MIIDPPDRELPGRRTPTLPSMPEIIEEDLEKDQIKTLSVSIVIRKDIRRQIVGLKVEVRRDKVPDVK